MVMPVIFPCAKIVSDPKMAEVGFIAKMAGVSAPASRNLESQLLHAMATADMMAPEAKQRKHSHHEESCP